MVSDSDRTHAAEQLGRTLPMLGNDEVVVLAALAKRILVGQQQYGKLDLANDRRDWRKEKAEEEQDWLFYAVFEDLKREMVRDRAPIGPIVVANDNVRPQLQVDMSDCDRDANEPEIA